MIYFEQAQLEFFGMPIAYFPVFLRARPDREAQDRLADADVLLELRNTASASRSPYFWALAPDYDLTLSPTITTKQGPLMQAEWRQRLINGSYHDPRRRHLPVGQGRIPARRRHRRRPAIAISAAASKRSGSSRSITTSGSAGWDIVAPTDKTFYQDYNLRKFSRHQHRSAPELGLTEGISQLYVTGRGDRSYFDARSHLLLRLLRSRQPEPDADHPSGDGLQLHLRPAGARRRARLQLQPHEPDAARRPRSTRSRRPRVLNGLCAPISGRPGGQEPRPTACCAASPAPTRASRPRPIGSGPSPIRSARCSRRSSRCAADVASVDVQNEPGVSELHRPRRQRRSLRAMPTVGMEYRYPFISVQSWGTQTIEPIAQIIVRPNETSIGKIPERRRAKPDLRRQQPVPRRQVLRLGPHRRRRPRQCRRAIYRAVQSRRLRQRPVRAVLSPVRQELVRRRRHHQYRPQQRPRHRALRLRGADVVPAGPHLHVHVALPLRREHLRRSPVRARRRARISTRWSLPALYGNYDAQPATRLPDPPRGHSRRRAVKLTPNWVGATARPATTSSTTSSTRPASASAISTIALSWPLNYITDYNYSGNATIDHRVLLQLSLRTLGGTSVTQTRWRNRRRAVVCDSRRARFARPIERGTMQMPDDVPLPSRLAPSPRGRRHGCRVGRAGACRLRRAAGRRHRQRRADHRLRHRAAHQAHAVVEPSRRLRRGRK